MLTAGFQRDKYIDAIRRTDALLEYAVQHGMDEEAERLRAELRKLPSMGEPQTECKPVWNGWN